MFPYFKLVAPRRMWDKQGLMRLAQFRTASLHNTSGKINKTNKVAEREGFEPPIPVKVYTLSRRAPSATRPSLRARLAAVDTSILSVLPTAVRSMHRFITILFQVQDPIGYFIHHLDHLRTHRLVVEFQRCSDVAVPQLCLHFSGVRLSLAVG